MTEPRTEPLDPLEASATMPCMVRRRTRPGPRGSLADALRAARATRGLSQAAAAESIGVHRVTLSKWETGEHRPKGLVLRLVKAWIKESERRGGHGA